MTQALKKNQSPLWQKPQPEGKLDLTDFIYEPKRHIKYASGYADLDQFLAGGLPSGCVCEWGVPFGQGGRELILSYIAQATHMTSWCLWVSSDESIEVYPPSWASYGVDLDYVRFVQTKKVLEDLKPAFLDPFFKVVVLDNPDHLSKDDLAFISASARSQNQLVLILRNYFLKQEKGNVFARYRFNCKRRLDGELSFVSIKGARPQGISIKNKPSLERMVLAEAVCL